MSVAGSSLVKDIRLTQTGSEAVVLDKFGVWLEKTKEAKIILKKKGVGGWGFGIDDILVLDYLHRFKEAYVRKTLRKFRRICEKKRGEPYIHLTLTCYRDSPIPISIQKLKDGWNKLRTFLVKRHGKIDYLAVLEPHRDGFPHLHVLVFTLRYLINQGELSVLWQKYGVGRVVYLKRYWNWGRDSKGLYYLAKYLNKYHKDVPMVLRFLNGQTIDFKRAFQKRVVFYAWLWFGRFKTYSFSHGFSGLWVKSSSGEWELWLFCWSEAQLKVIFWFYGIRFDRLLDEWCRG